MFSTPTLRLWVPIQAIELGLRAWNELMLEQELPLVSIGIRCLMAGHDPSEIHA